MRFKLYDPFFGDYYVHAEVVTWVDGVLTLTTSYSDFNLRCSKKFWEKIKFWFWFGYCYIDLTRLSPVVVSSIDPEV